MIDVGHALFVFALMVTVVLMFLVGYWMTTWCLWRGIERQARHNRKARR